MGRFPFIIRRQIKEAVSMEKLADATWFALPHAVPVHTPTLKTFHLLQLHNEKAAKTFTREQMKDYQDASKYGLWIDGRRVENKYLPTYSPEDFFHRHKSKLMQNARHYGKYTYHLSLTTKAAHHRRREELKRLLKEM